jgi:hypothetical protein
MAFGMEDTHWRLGALLIALIVTGCLTGGGIYEQSVLDTAWPRKPSIVRPTEGGANRKLFWLPANIVAILILLVALAGAWPRASARYATLVAVGLFAIINLVTVLYLGPAVLRVEKSSPPPDDASSLASVRRSRWRTPLFIGVNVALAVAYCCHEDDEVNVLQQPNQSTKPTARLRSNPIEVATALCSGLSLSH